MPPCIIDNYLPFILVHAYCVIFTVLCYFGYCAFMHNRFMCRPTIRLAVDHVIRQTLLIMTCDCAICLYCDAICIL